MILVSYYICEEFFGVSCIQGCKLLPNGEWDCPSCHSCRINEQVPILLLLIIPNYFLSCLLIHIIDSTRSKVAM